MDGRDPSVVMTRHRTRWMGSRLLRSAALGTVVVLAFTACIKTSGGGASPNPNNGVPNPNKPPPGGSTSTPAPTTAFYIPLAFDLPDAVLSALQVMPRPTTWSADVNTIQQPPAIRASFKKDGFLSEGEQVVAKTGVKLDDPKSWPDGSSVYLEWKMTYFQTPDDASAATQFAGKNERGKPVTLSGLGTRGISAFQAVNPDEGLVTQSWYAVRGNAFVNIIDTGKYKEGAVQADQLALFDDILKLLTAAPAPSATTLSKGQAAEAYLAAVGPVNKAEAPFWSMAMQWPDSISNAKAVAQSAKVLAAFTAIPPKLLDIADGYPKAANALRADIAAASVLQYDLTELKELDKIGVRIWLDRYGMHISSLSAISNRVRKALGLPVLGA